MKVYLIILVLSIIVVVAGVKEEIHTPVHKPHEKDGEHNKHFDHEAVIGSKKGEEEFDELDEEESKRRLSILVSEHDPNKDNIITKDELIQWLLQSFRGLDEEEALEKMEEEDKDGNGQISWRELVKQQYSYDLEDIEDFHKHIDKQKKEMKEFLQVLDDEEKRFQNADLNTDGYLEKTEYMAFYHPNEYPHMFETEIKRALKHSDKDNSGDISKAEFIGDVTDREARLVEEENFKTYDTNKDGKLSKSEIQGWVIQDNRQAAEDEAEHLFGIADANKNGELAMSEILEHYDEFVGSQATDYGRHLEDEL